MSDTLAAEYVKSHSRKVSDVMTRDVITTSPQAPLHEVAAADGEERHQSDCRCWRTVSSSVS